jgi:hypothetical protein
VFGEDCSAWLHSLFLSQDEGLPRLCLADFNSRISVDVLLADADDIGDIAVSEIRNYTPASNCIDLRSVITERKCMIRNTVILWSDDGQPSEHVGTRGPN